MRDHSFARRVVEESSDHELLEFLHFLEQTEQSDDEYLSRDAEYMIRLVNAELRRRRIGMDAQRDLNRGRSK